MSTRRSVLCLMFVFVAWRLAAPAYAQEAPAAGAANSGLVQWSIITAGFALAIAAFGGALGQGRAVASAAEAIARNPGAVGEIRGVADSGPRAHRVARHLRAARDADSVLHQAVRRR